MVQSYKYWLNRKPEDQQKDWKYSGSWLEGYEKSVVHPHRQLILNELKGVRSLLELGCNCGANFLAIRKKFPNTYLAGIDANQDAVNRAQELFPIADIQQGNILELPWDTGSFDVVLADAVLMYIPPAEIITVIAEMDRVAVQKIIIVDRMANSRLGVDTGYVWSRNYPQLLKELGMKVQVTKLTEETWPHSQGWAHTGYIWVATRT